MMEKILITAFIVLVVASNAFAAENQPGDKDWNSWTACSANEECVAIHDACGGWTAVNGQFKDQGIDYQRNSSGAADCGFVRLDPEPKVLCIKHACTVKPTRMDLN